MWSEVGTVPGLEEVEVTVLGPGYGESVVVHLGRGEWMIIDSCIDQLDGSRRSAPLLYLEALGVTVSTAVKFVVVTHWDDDHVKGIADVVEACASADVVTSDVFCNEKFTTFVEAISTGASQTEGGNVENMRRLLTVLHDRQKPIKRAAPARQLNANPVVRCWSPSDADRQEFLNYVASLHPRAKEGMRKAIPRTPNLTSVVITVEWEDAAVLLAADMERSLDGNRGWGAVISEATKIGVKQSSLVKIPHHGSETGHDEGMWASLLAEMPISVIAPFGKGPVASRPPRSGDIRRIAKRSQKLFLTARHTTATRPKMDLAVERSLREGLIRITSRKTQMGIVRHRKDVATDWTSEIFGAAFRAK